MYTAKFIMLNYTQFKLIFIISIGRHCSIKLTNYNNLIQENVPIQCFDSNYKYINILAHLIYYLLNNQIII